MTLRGVPIVVDPNTHTTYRMDDLTTFGGEDHWRFAPMIHLAFGEMGKGIWASGGGVLATLALLTATVLLASRVGLMAGEGMSKCFALTHPLAIW